MTQPITTQQPIKLIAVDLDGTLLNSQHELSDRNEKALKDAMAKGIKVIIATGKTFPSAAHIIKRLGITLPGVFVQGTTIYNADGTLHNQKTLDINIARQVITFAEDRGYHMAVYSGKRILVRYTDKRVEELTTHFGEPLPEAVGPLQNILDTIPVNKVLAVAPADPHRIAALRWQLSMQLNGTATLLNAGISDMLEVLPPGASKGGMVKALIKELGVPANQVLACGDAENDVEMLELAGIGVAMGNANQHIKSIANVVVATNDNDGVAEAVERFVLNVDLGKTQTVAASKVEASPTP